MAKTVLIMAGGTGGHVFPALAAAQKLLQQGNLVHWLGTRKGIEAELIPAADIPIHYIDVGGVRGKGILSLVKMPFVVLRAVWQALSIVRELKPASVLGMGGFAAGPGGLAAWLTRTPLVIHEQNAIAGTTNRILARFATRVLAAFPNTLPKAEHVGNPVRDEITRLSAPLSGSMDQDLSEVTKVLVLGGSLGAAAINELMPKALSLLPDTLQLSVWHQVGRKHEETAKQAYQDAGADARIEPFISDMASAYRWADMVVCRSGALTVSEISVAGLPAIFYSFPLRY